MPYRLPIELLALVASFASQPTLINLALASKAAYTVSLRPLYTFIPAANASRTVQCLTTLATKPQLAQLVQSYQLCGPEEIYNDYVHALVASALKNTSRLTELDVWLRPPFSSDVFKHARFKLRNLICWVESGSKYSITQFLNAQPELESLYYFCYSREDLSSLAPTALPALKDVGVSYYYSLQYLLSTRLTHIAHISLIGHTTYSALCHLTRLLQDAPTQPTSLIELVLGLKLNEESMHPEAIKSALSKLGSHAPWIGSLTLEVERGQFERGFLLNQLIWALRRYPSLHTFAISTYLWKPTDAHTDPDPIYDVAEYTKYVEAWCAACPTLERVDLPSKSYNINPESRGVREAERDEACKINWFQA